jgi:hypothetical protein
MQCYVVGVVVGCVVCGVWCACGRWIRVFAVWIELLIWWGVKIQKKLFWLENDLRVKLGS